MANNADRIIAEMRRELAKFMKGAKNVTVGIHEDAGMHEGGITNAQLGALLNYGNPDNKMYGKADAPIPARPWLVPGVEKSERDIIDAVGKGIADGQNVEQLIEQAGVIAAGSVQQYMTDLSEPANSPVTIAKKGSSNPLIDTGSLRQSVTYKIARNKPQEGL